MSDNIDKAAHDLMNFKPQKVTRVHGYEVFYHEERLYTVRDSNTGITSLVYAREPREAVEKVIKIPAVPQEMSASEFLKILKRQAIVEQREVHIQFYPTSYTLGDFDAWIAQVEQWAKEHPEERSEQ